MPPRTLPVGNIQKRRCASLSLIDTYILLEDPALSLPVTGRTYLPMAFKKTGIPSNAYEEYWP